MADAGAQQQSNDVPEEVFAAQQQSNDVPEEVFAASSPTNAKTVDAQKYRVDLDNLLSFLFPQGYQHPLVAGRLMAFGYYGPLDENLNIRSGIKGSRILLDYELESLCLQLEREDIVSIYLHRKRDLGLLSSAEQESIIAQADAHLKKAKGKASLPRLEKPDIYSMFRDLVRDADGLLSFHEMQKRIDRWRADRIKQYKLVFPEMGSGLPPDTRPHRTGHFERGPAGPPKLVSEAIAPKSLFQRKKGLNNADVVEAQVRLLTKYACQLTEVGNASAEGMTSNVRLLRDVAPTLGVYDPYLDKTTGKRSKGRWDPSTSFKLGGH